MAHPYKSHQEVHPGRKAAHARVKEYKRGGAAKHSDEKEDRALIKKMLKQHEKEEGEEYNVGGKVSTPRADKFARGGHVKKHGKGHTHINIAVVAPHHKNMAGPNVPPPMPPQAPMAPPPGADGTAGGAPTPPGMPMPPGMPPGGMMNRGGKVKMTAGAESGEGRLQKIKAYGKNARRGKD